MATNDKHCQTITEKPVSETPSQSNYAGMYDETIVVNGKEIESPSSEEEKKPKTMSKFNPPVRHTARHDFDSESDSDTGPENFLNDVISHAEDESPDRKTLSDLRSKESSLVDFKQNKAGISRVKPASTLGDSSNSETDSGDLEPSHLELSGAGARKRGGVVIPAEGAYDPKIFQDLKVPTDIENLFQYIMNFKITEIADTLQEITSFQCPKGGESIAINPYEIHGHEFMPRHNRLPIVLPYLGVKRARIQASVPLPYTPQKIDIQYKLQPFLPDYVPSVGDIDAFLKVTTPVCNVRASPLGDHVLEHIDNLGLTVLDEPAAEQSDSALLHLQLRAISKTTSAKATVLTKKIENAEKNSKAIDRWIKDVSELHLSKPAPTVGYTSKMPDIDSLMEEWPESMEEKLNEVGFPPPNLDCTLSQYIDLVCGIFDIPIAGDTLNDRIQALHMLFSLYSAVKNSQLYVERQKEKDSVS